MSVLSDVDLEPADDGVRLPGRPPVWLPWSECRRALDGHPPESGTGRRRLTDWLQARRWAADLAGPAGGPGRLAGRLRPVGLPVDHLLHPGPDWAQQRVLGDALDLGIGAVGLDPDDPDRVVLLPRPALDEAGLSGADAWPAARARLEELGRLAASLVARDARGRLRPVGDCDVVTLLGARSLRTALAGASGGMTGVVAPMRTRGWTRLALIDPAFGPAAAAATPAADRGFPRPLLVTADEVTVVPDGGRPATLALRQAAAPSEPWGRDVLR